MARVFSEYMKSRSGVVAIIFGLSVPLIIGAVGLSIDVGQTFLVRERLSHALDAAALAAATISSDSEDEIQETVESFIAANYPPDKIGYTIDVQTFPTDDSLRVEATARLDTSFMRLFGQDTVDVHVVSEVSREVRGIEVALVLDVTGSMSTNNNIGTLRTATQNFITTIFNRVEDEDFLKVALVPYAATVNVGSIAPSIVSAVPQWPAGTDRPYSATNAAGAADDLNWRGCVRARTAPNDSDDTTVSAGGYWVPFWYANTPSDSNDNKWWNDANNNGVYNGTSENSLNLPYTQANNRRTPNLGCPEDNPIVPLTNNQTVLANAASGLVYWSRGGTMGNEGLAWGLRVLSPTEPFTEGADYDDVEWKKAVIMMTDGDNLINRKAGIVATSDDTAYGRVSEGKLGTTNINTAKTKVDNKMSALCTQMKALGITVYTITFSSSIDTATKTLYRNCASDEGKYHNAPTQASLIEVYNSIAKELSNLHISR